MAPLLMLNPLVAALIESIWLLTVWKGTYIGTKVVLEVYSACISKQDCQNQSRIWIDSSYLQGSPVLCSRGQMKKHNGHSNTSPIGTDEGTSGQAIISPPGACTVNARLWYVLAERRLRSSKFGARRDTGIDIVSEAFWSDLTSATSAVGTNRARGCNFLSESPAPAATAAFVAARTECDLYFLQYSNC